MKGFRSTFIFMMLVVLLLPNTCGIQAKARWKKITKKSISHTWYNAAYYEDDWVTNYSSDYVTIFRKNGKVVQKGYRNKDYGTYKISKDRKKVVATFNKCYFDTPGEGYLRMKRYKYSVIYRMKNKYTLYAKYSEEATSTNAESGYLYR